MGAAASTQQAAPSVVAGTPTLRQAAGVTSPKLVKRAVPYAVEQSAAVGGGTPAGATASSARGIELGSSRVVEGIPLAAVRSARSVKSGASRDQVPIDELAARLAARRTELKAGLVSSPSAQSPKVVVVSKVEEPKAWGLPGKQSVAMQLTSTAREGLTDANDVLPVLLQMWRLRTQLAVIAARDAAAAHQAATTVPTAPVLVAATGISLSVQWTCGSTDVVRYELQIKPASSIDQWRTVSRAIKAERFTMTGLSSGVSYVFRVRARIDEAWSNFSPVSTEMATLRMCPSRPAPPVVTAVTTCSITCKWTEPPNNGARISLYTVLIGAGSSTDMSVLYSGPDLECEALNLQPCSSYYFRIIATNAFGDSDVSGPTEVVTLTPRTDAPLRTVGPWVEWWDAGSRRSYFVNETTQERSWTLPAYLNTLMRRFGDWSEYWDETTQHCFYYNHRTGERSWEPPSNIEMAAEEALVKVGATQGRSTAAVGAAGAAAGAAAASASVLAGGADTQDSDDESYAVGDSAVAPVQVEPTAADAKVDEGPDSRFTMTAVGAVSEEDIVFRRKRFKLLWDARQSHVRPGRVILEIRRARVISDSLAAFRRFHKPDLQHKLVVHFAGEEGIDSGGLTKDWCLLFSRSICSAVAGLFITTPAGFVEISPSITNIPTGLECLYLLGRFVGKAVFDRQLVDMRFSSALIKSILGQQVTLADLEESDPDLQRGLQWALNNDITGVIDATFSVDDLTRAPRAMDVLSDARDGSGTADAADLAQDVIEAMKPAPVTRPVAEDDEDDGMVELIPGGKDIVVTENNKQQYVQAMIAWRGGKQVEGAVAEFARGIFELLPSSLLCKFTVAEFRALLNGRADIDLAVMRRTTNYTGGLQGKSQVVKWLWRALASFQPAERALFLKFCTGTSSVPLDGFEPPFTLTGGTDMAPDALPRSHTCFNQLVLPPYASFDVLRSKLLFAVQNTDSFGIS